MTHGTPDKPKILPAASSAGLAVFTTFAALAPFAAFAASTVVAFTSSAALAADGDSDAPAKPAWASVLSQAESGGYRYFVGVASEAASREEALEKAWLNALGGVARTQFPALVKISESSRESLKDSTYRRDSSVALDRVHWDGIEEAAKSGSPFFEVKEVDGKEVITSYRLLRWKTSDIEKERERLAAGTALYAVAGDAASISYDSAIGKKGAPAGSLTVTSSPPGALVLIDGEFAGKTNASFARIGAGSYQVAIQLDGFETREEQVTVTAGGKDHIDVKLQKNHGTAEITSTPSGAVVYVNNVPLSDRTPVTIERELGDYDIRVEAGGYYPASKVVTIGYRKASEAFDLKTKPGKLSVLTSPAGADVDLSGQNLGASNVIDRLIPGGSYEVSVSKSGFLPQKKTVEISEARGQTVVFKLESESDIATKEKEAAAKAESDKEKAMTDDQKKTRDLKHFYGTSFVVCGVSAIVAGIGAAAFQTMADDSYSKYKASTNGGDATKYRSQTGTYDGGALILSAVGIVLGSASFYSLKAYLNTKDPQATLSANTPSGYPTAAVSFVVGSRGPGFALTMTSAMPIPPSLSSSPAWPSSASPPSSAPP